MANDYYVLIRNSNGRISSVEEVSEADFSLSLVHDLLDAYRRSYGFSGAETADVLVDVGFGIMFKLITAT